VVGAGYIINVTNYNKQTVGLMLSAGDLRLTSVRNASSELH